MISCPIQVGMLVPSAGNHRLYHSHSLKAIRPISIGTDTLGIFLGNRRSANYHLNLTSDPGFLECLYHIGHPGHGAVG